MNTITHKKVMCVIFNLLKITHFKQKLTHELGNESRFSKSLLTRI